MTKTNETNLMENNEVKEVEMVQEVKQVDLMERIKALNIFEKVCQISNEVEYLQKDDKVGFGNNSYKAISIEKVMNALGKKMSYYGLVILQKVIETSRKDEEIPSVDKNGNHVIKYNRVTDVTMSYTVVNAHNPSEQFEVTSCGTGVDSQDKGIGKAMTYAYKNMLIKLFNIPTGDDTDKVHSEDYSNRMYGETSSQADALYKLAQTHGIKPYQVNGGCQKYYGKLPNQLNNKEFEEMKERLNKSK